MQKPIMIKYILTISLCFFCLLLPGHADARLTLGAVPSDDALTVDKINAIAASIAGSLGEEVAVKELADSGSLVNWLDRFATLDLALFTARDVADYHGRFLMIGPLDEAGSLNLVARQGVSGDLPGRLSGFVSETGFVPGRSLSHSGPPEESSEAKALPVVEPPQRIAAGESQPPLTQGRAWVPDDGLALRDILPAEQPQLQKLVLGVVPEPTGIVNTGAQAERLAAYLENVLPVDVTVRVFDQVETFSAWFTRYRMVDIAVLSSDLAARNLGVDYLPIIKLLRSDKPGEDSAELVVVRRGQDEALQELLQQAILDVPEADEGKELMAALNVSELFVPGMKPDRVEIADEEQEPVAGLQAAPVTEDIAEPAPVIKPERIYPTPTEILPPAIISVPKPPQVTQIPAPETTLPAPDVPTVLPVTVTPIGEAIEPGVKTVEDVIADTLLVPPAPEAPAPVPPVAPAKVGVVELPVIAKVAEPSALPPEPVVSASAPALPTAGTEPVAPAQLKEVAPVELPVPVIAKVEPLSPTLPMPPTVSAPASTSRIEATDVPDAEPVVEVPEDVVVSPPPVAAVDVPTVVDPDAMSGSASAEEPLSEDQAIIEEVLTFADPVSSHELDKQIFMIPDEDAEQEPDEDLLAMLGEDPVAAMVAQPNLPQELRPSGVPIVRPRPTPQKTASAVEDLLVASIPEPLRQVEPEKPPVLLPQPDPDPGIVYVVPFVSVMVPAEVSSRIFDQFVDSLNQQGEALGLQFLILKEGLQRVAPEWLVLRKYVTGELYAYVEDSGCCSTDLRSKARLTYRKPNQQQPAFGFEYPVRNFFDHDRSTLEIERTKMADDVAATLADELIKALKN